MLCVDFPISLISVPLGWALGIDAANIAITLYFFIAGTLWYYLIGIALRFMAGKEFKRRDPLPSAVRKPQFIYNFRNVAKEILAPWKNKFLKR